MGENFIVNHEEPLNRQFASDNYSGICPEAWTAFENCNIGHSRGYGEDTWTESVANQIRDIFETDCQVYFVFNGTAANSLSLSSMCQSYHSILCHKYAHLERDECGAPEFFSNGAKVILLEGENGKLNSSAIESEILKRNDLHYPKPRAISLTQATEFGTVYSVEELQSIHEMTRKHGLLLHMDGARFANAVTALGIQPKEITWKAGLDVLCFGGTKNGIGIGEAVVFFNQELAHEFDYRCKQSGQLASKMRFLSAPWIGLLKNDTWLKNANHSNEMAKKLDSRIREISEIKVLFPCQANSIFAAIPKNIVEKMYRKGWIFYNFIGEDGYRLMCSWDTQEEDVDRLIADFKSCLK